MRFQKGSYQTPDFCSLLNSFSVESLYGNVGDLPIAHRKQLTVTATIEGTSQADIDAKIATTEEALRASGEDCGILRTDGTPTQHYLDYSSSESGVRLKGFGWAPGEGGEFATRRTFQATFEAIYTASGENQLISLQERISIRGGGKPSYTLLPTVSGGSIVQQTSGSMGFVLTQQGSAFGTRAAPAANTPLGTQFTAHEVSAIDPKITRSGPLRRGYGTAWNYSFVSADGITY